MSNIRARIRFAMEDAGLSQNEVERRAKFSQGTLSNILRGHRANPSSESLRRIAEALGVYTSWLLGEQDYPIWRRDKASAEPAAMAEIEARLRKLERADETPSQTIARRR